MKKQKSIYNGKFLNFWYCGFNGNKVNVIKFKLIGAYLHVQNIYTFYEKNWKNKNYVRDLWKYGANFDHSKVGFLREDFHIKVYYLMLHHILSHYV